MTTQRKDEMQLKPCPFCGGKAEWCTGKTGVDAKDDWNYIACEDCEAMGSYNSSQREGLIHDWNNRADLSPPVPDDVADIDISLSYVKTVLGGLETEPEHVKDAIQDEKTRNKALDKIQAKIDIFDTLEAVCEDYLIRAASTPSAEVRADKCPDCGSEMMDVCSGLEKWSKESCDNTDATVRLADTKIKALEAEVRALREALSELLVIVDKYTPCQSGSSFINAKKLLGGEIK